MNRLILFGLLLLCAIGADAQGVVKGKVLDKKSNEALEYINVVVTKRGEEKILKGALTDVSGNFTVTGLADGNYTLKVSFTGYKDLVRNFTISSKSRTRHFTALYLSEDSHLLEEVTVTAQRQEMKLEVDRKSFNVDQQISNAGGSASDALENIPSVEVDQDGNVSLRGNSSVEVWINGKSSGLTSDNRAEILQQLPAESIERIEVIDNPSAKFSAEGSAGIINIVLKKDRKAGYYGSVQAGADTRKGAQTSFNFNYNSGKWDAFVNVGYRHRHSKGGAVSDQTFLNSNTYQNYSTRNTNMGNGIFARAGLTWHATKKDDLSLTGMTMHGGGRGNNMTPYHYGTIGAAEDTRTMYRYTNARAGMHMWNGELNYRHNFTDRHFLDLTVSYGQWKSRNDNIYQDSTTYNSQLTIDNGQLTIDNGQLTMDNGQLRPTEYMYQSRPQNINNRAWEVKLDYENPISDKFLLQAGYNGRFSHENTPQESYIDDGHFDGSEAVEDKAFFNRFIYDMDVHALYATGTLKLGKFGIMAGLRGEYWKVDTKSYNWEQEHYSIDNGQLTMDNYSQPSTFKKDYFQLFPSIFLSYQITPTGQLQLNYTRRLKRPWGGQLNSFKNTRDATVISYGNPELTPEYSNSFSLNYLKQWKNHSLLVSAYYRPTTDVMQRITYQSSTDGLMYQTNFNVAKSTSSGLEITAKNKLFRILDLSTSANFYYYKVDGFDFDIDGQTVSGEGNHNFTWNVRTQASVMLPYGISFQATGRYRARQVTAQGYRKANYNIDLGVRKSFLNKQLTLAINCRDLLNSRRWRTYTETDDFTRHQENWRRGRSVRFTLTYSFGNNTPKRKGKPQQGEQEENDFNSSYEGGGEE